MYMIEFHRSYFGMKIDLSNVQQEIYRQISHVKLTMLDYNVIILCFEYFKESLVKSIF